MNLKPASVPPLQRINKNTINEHTEVEMISAGHAACAAGTQEIAFLYHIILDNLDLAQMGIEAEYALTMIDDHGIAVNSLVLGKHHPAAVGGLDIGMADRGQVNA